MNIFTPKNSIEIFSSHGRFVFDADSFWITRDELQIFEKSCILLIILRLQDSFLKITISSKMFIKFKLLKTFIKNGKLSFYDFQYWLIVILC